LPPPAARFLSANPRFAASPLARYRPADIVARMNAWGLAWHEKARGQLFFCDGRADRVVAALCADLAAAGGRLWTGCALGPVARDGAFRVETARGPVVADSLIVATGGLSIPKMGATGLGYALARRFGLRLVGTRPGLVPLTFGDGLRAGMAALAGLGVVARVSAGRPGGGGGFEDGLLFTHRGLSGPSILQVSSYWRPGAAIAVDFLPGRDAVAELAALRRGAGRRRPATRWRRCCPNGWRGRWRAGLWRRGGWVTLMPARSPGLRGCSAAGPCGRPDRRATAPPR
jgi:predicted flavoprotein YhiN